jgi:hypothetical protein
LGERGDAGRRPGLAVRLAGVVGFGLVTPNRFFDNSEVVWNIEASNTEGGFRVNSDRFYQEQYNVPQEQIDLGSALTFLKPRQLLGLFVGAAATRGTPATSTVPRRLSSRPSTCFPRAACSGERWRTAPCGTSSGRTPSIRHADASPALGDAVKPDGGATCDLLCNNSMRLHPTCANATCRWWHEQRVW